MEAGGSGGTAGLGGSGGFGGTAAGRGGGGGLPQCDISGGGTQPVIAVAVAGPDGNAVVSAVTAAVIVTAIDSCVSVGCPSSLPAPSANPGLPGVYVRPDSTRIVLTSADTRTG
jgi:hypothetical protein